LATSGGGLGEGVGDASEVHAPTALQLGDDVPDGHLVCGGTRSDESDSGDERVRQKPSVTYQTSQRFGSRPRAVEALHSIA
jgi:hypothetical protein